ncbi:hypothetical protein LCGC14_1368260 [marine sediment metagenome]|uniref:Uncharacterized protein n=1 Tax=marine sediment metagenome TaxID=412755 RepID=A0A0F9ML79_9ZZZZ
MNKEELEKKPYYSVYFDLMRHPIFCLEDKEFMVAIADFIYQLGYRKRGTHND